eukprot:GHVS01078627.1.p1 GENE.GHVS01078627.1~~GHVS01078627.1.p1  ORF type:complete len:331 (+),score=40.60 GHVS01078627.1:95-1087(+)
MCMYMRICVCTNKETTELANYISMGNCMSAIRRLPVVLLSRFCHSSSSSSLPFLYHATPSSPNSSGYALEECDVPKQQLPPSSLVTRSSPVIVSSRNSSPSCLYSSSSLSPSSNRPRHFSFSLPPASASSTSTYGGSLCVLLCGAPRSGKTALLYRAKLGAFILTLPTQGLTKECFQIPLGPEGFMWWMDVWDTARRGPQDALWREIHQQCNAVVFVIDSLDRRKLDQARSDFLDLFYEEHFAIQQQIRFLIFCTKQDARSALSPADIESALDLPSDVKQRCSVMGCSAMSGDGIREGLEWLAGIAWVPLQSQPGIKDDNNMDRSGSSYR